MDRWGYWLNEPIYTDSGVYSIEKRKHAIHCFCYQGLIPLVESMGYKFRLNDKELFVTMLSLLFKMHEGHAVAPHLIDIEHAKEQYDTFYYKLDAEIWERFWMSWGTLQDFDIDRYAFKLRYELPIFVWSWLDFERSPTVLDLYKELEEDEVMDEMSKGREDPYLQETSKRDYQDRHW